MAILIKAINGERVICETFVQGDQVVEVHTADLDWSSVPAQEGRIAYLLTAEGNHYRIDVPAELLRANQH